MWSLACPAIANPSTTQAPPAASPSKSALDELREIEDKVQRVVERAAPVTVCLVIGGATGSGIIVDDKGTILTAGHVSGQPGRPVTIIFPDGKRAKGTTLGQNAREDGGMVRITDKAPDGGWPHIPLAQDDSLAKMDWVVALGHPGGFEADRPIVARLGRVQSLGWQGITTDCTLLGGDSGGPLFDLEGRVVAIHSRIGLSTTQNIHVPASVYREGWTRFAAGELWNQWMIPNADPDAPFLGVAGRDHRRGVEVLSVVDGSPAAAAGLQAHDVITAIDGRPIENYNQLIETIATLKAGQKVRIVLLRDGRSRKIDATIQRRGGDDAPQ